MDQAKHGHRLSPAAIPTSVCTPDIVVDSHNPDRVEHVLNEITRGSLRFGIDTRGKDTATFLLRSLVRSGSDSNETTTENAVPKKRSHLVGLTGLPKLSPTPLSTDSTTTTARAATVSLHSVPIKIFHEVPEIGLVLSVWLEKLMEKGKLKPPQAVGTEDGLEGVNRGLRTMREQGGRVVVRI